MIHPEVAVQNGYQVKMYSDVPVPSSSIGFKSTYQLSTSGKGTFALTWTPNFLCTVQQLQQDSFLTKATSGTATVNYSNLAYNNHDLLTGTNRSSYFEYQPCYKPDTNKTSEQTKPKYIQT